MILVVKDLALLASSRQMDSLLMTLTLYHNWQSPTICMQRKATIAGKVRSASWRRKTANRKKLPVDTLLAFAAFPP